MRQRAEFRLFLEHGDVSGGGIDHIGAGMHGVGLLTVKRGIRNNGGISLSSGLGQGVQAPRAGSLPGIGGSRRDGGFGHSIQRLRLFGVPCFVGDAGSGIGIGIVQRRIRRDIKITGLHDSRDGRSGIGGEFLEIQRIGHHLQAMVFGQGLVEFLDRGGFLLVHR